MTPSLGNILIIHSLTPLEKRKKEIKVMSAELQELLVQVEAIEAKDVEVGHVLRALIDYLAKREKLPAQAKSSKGGNNGD